MKFLSILLLLFLPFFSSSQSFQKSWELSRDTVGYTEFTRMAVLPDHSIALTGNIVEFGFKYPIIMCVDSSGQRLWNKIYRDTFTVVQLSSSTAYQKKYETTFLSADSSGITICGWMDSTYLSRIFPDPSWSEDGHLNFPFLIKTDLQGNLLWKKIYSVTFSSNSSYETNRYMFFQDGSSGYLISRAYLQNGGIGILFSKINPNDGSVQFSKIFRTNTYTLSCAVYASGKIIFSYSDMFPSLGCIDTSGNWNWGMQVSNPDIREISDMKISHDSSKVYLMINGEYPSSIPAAGKIDIDGNNFWAAQLSLPLYSRGLSVCDDASGNFYLSPQLMVLDSSGQGTWSSANFSGGKDLMIDGNTLYSCGGGRLMKTPTLGLTTCDSSIFPVTSSTYSFIAMNPAIHADTVISCYASELSVIPMDTIPMDQLHCLILSSQEIANTNLTLSPNPAYQKFEISDEYNHVKIYSADGVDLSSKLQMENNYINIGSFSSGVYFVHVFLDDGRRIIKTLLINR